MTRVKAWIPILVLLVPILAACGATSAPGGGGPYGSPAAATPTTAVQPTAAPTEQPTQTPTEAPTGGGSTVQVVMKNTSFQPAQITVKVGTTVTWVNDDPVAHTVSSGTRSQPTNLFDSGNVGPGQSFSFTFDQPGTYDYFCKIHPGMDGVVIVQP
jgi:plastocyanin